VKSVAYSKSALKVLAKMPKNLAKRITGKVEQYAVDPARQANTVKALTGSPYIRLRVGDWRVIMDDQGTVLAVLEIGTRGDIYR
jgi:mRNA interferase RelE/StbE